MQTSFTNYKRHHLGGENKVADKEVSNPQTQISVGFRKGSGSSASFWVHYCKP